MLQMPRVIFSVKTNKAPLSPGELGWGCAKPLIREERVQGSTSEAKSSPRLSCPSERSLTSL